MGSSGLTQLTMNFQQLGRLRYRKMEDIRTGMTTWMCIVTKHFRYPKMGGILTYISCMDTAHVREFSHP